MLKKLSIIFILFSALLISDAFAGKPEAVFKDWSVFKIIQNNEHICYIASTPIKKEGTYRKRGEPFITVIRVKGNTYDEVNVSSGYPYSQETKPQIIVNKKKFDLFSYEERAWGNTKADDVLIVNAMKKNIKMKVQGYSKVGTQSLDTYSLLGFSDAYNKMAQICN